MQLLNAAVLRRAALSVALVVWIAGCSGQTDTVTLASCSFALSPSSASHTASGGTGSVPVEVEYYRNGGILQTVLRKLVKEA